MRTTRLRPKKGVRRAVLAQLDDVLAVEPESVKLKSLSAITADMVGTFELVSDLRRRVANIPIPLMLGEWNPLVHEHAAKLAVQLEPGELDRLDVVRETR